MVLDSDTRVISTFGLPMSFKNSLSILKIILPIHPNLVVGWMGIFTQQQLKSQVFFLFPRKFVTFLEWHVLIQHSTSNNLMHISPLFKGHENPSFLYIHSRNDSFSKSSCLRIRHLIHLQVQTGSRLLRPGITLQIGLMAYSTRYILQNIKIIVKLMNSSQLVEQLSLHYSKWKTNLDIKETLSITQSTRKPLQAQISDVSRSALAPSIPALPLRPHYINQGFLPLNRTLAQAGPSGTSHTPTSTISTVTHNISRKRVANILEDTRVIKKPRVRHCGKCGSNTCNGKQKRERCSNPCQDCKKIECKGRDLKSNPDKPCFLINC